MTFSTNKKASMKNTKSNNLSKKGQHTFNKNLKHLEEGDPRKTARKTKQARLLEAWS